LAAQLNAASILLDKMEHWSTELRKIESLIAGITILGFLKAPNTTESIASYLYHLDSNVKKTAVDSLRSLNSPECLNYVFAPLKMSDDSLALDILDLVGSFKAKSTILPLLYAMSGTQEIVLKKILSILTSFSKKDLLTVLGNHLAEEDVELCRNVLSIFEYTGELEIARRIRAQYKVTQTIQPVKVSDTCQLEFQIKKTGDIAIVALAGILDVYTLHKLTTIMEHLLSKGHYKILLFCEQVRKIDREAYTKIRDLAEKLNTFGGVLKVIALNSGTAKGKLNDLLGNVENYSSLKEAVMSFSLTDLDKPIRFSSGMLTPGTTIELEVKAGLNVETRFTKVLSFDGQYCVLEWASRQGEDVFKETLSPDVKIIIPVRNLIVAFKAHIVEQVFSPEPCVTLSKPRMGRVIAQRRHVRVATDLPLLFFHVLDSTKVRKGLQGLCKNISVGGILLSTRENIPVNDIAILLFSDHPELRGKKLLAKVAWRGKSLSSQGPTFEHGLNFVHLQPDLLEALARLIGNTISEITRQSQ